jgi:hypothetical protein
VHTLVSTTVAHSCYFSEMSDEEARRARAEARASWPGTLTTLEEQSDAIVVRHGTPGERVGMVWQITLDVWASSGRPLPEYTRATMPGRIIRSSDG